jgi:hypothetical protein
MVMLASQSLIKGKARRSVGSFAPAITIYNEIDIGEEETDIHSATGLAQHSHHVDSETSLKKEVME